LHCYIQTFRHEFSVLSSSDFYAPVVVLDSLVTGKAKWIVPVVAIVHVQAYITFVQLIKSQQTKKLRSEYSSSSQLSALV